MKDKKILFTDDLLEFIFMSILCGTDPEVQIAPYGEATVPL